MSIFLKIYYDLSCIFLFFNSFVNFSKRFSGYKLAAFATALLFKVNFAERHAFIERLAHIVNSQQCNAYSVQSLHLDSRSPHRLDSRYCFNGKFIGQHFKIQSAMIKRQRMT